MKEEISFSVKKKREEVFAALTDLKKIEEMSQGKVTIRPGTDADTFVIHADIPGMQEVTCRTTQWDPPTKCVRTFEIKDLPTTISLTFEEVGDQTKVTLLLEMTPESMTYKMMLPMLEKKLRAEKEKALAQLQTQLNA